jgi:hypothetical protein
MTDHSRIDRAIVKALRASLKLASTSSGRLSLSQLYALNSDLRKTMAVINNQIQVEESGTSIENVLTQLATHSCFIDDRKILLDVSDWDSESDEEKEAKKKDTSGVGSEYPLLPDFVAACSWRSQVVRAETNFPVRWQFSSVSVQC